MSHRRLPRRDSSLSDGAHSLRSRVVCDAVRREVQDLANYRRLYHAVLASLSFPTVLAQGPFAPGTLLPFLTPMGPCADPGTSHLHFRLSLIEGVLAACAIHGWLPGPSRLSVCFSFLKCRAPLPDGSSGALGQFFPDVQRPPPTPAG
jgi:hypothetical protein